MDDVNYIKNVMTESQYRKCIADSIKEREKIALFLIAYFFGLGIVLFGFSYCLATWLNNRQLVFVLTIPVVMLLAFHFKYQHEILDSEQ